MRRGRRGSLLAGVLVVCLVTSLFVPTVAADSHNASDDESDRSYQLVHGYDEAQVISVEPVAGEEAVEERYDPETESWGESSSSTEKYHKNDTSTLLLYEGPEGVSLVGLHDKYHSRQTAGTTGGSLSWTIDGLPENGEWAVIDDDSADDLVYVADDRRSGISDPDGEPTGEADALLSWVWSTSEAESVAYRGLNQDVSITIYPAVDEESYHRYGDQRRPNELPDRPDRGEGYNGTVDSWEVIVPTDDGFERADFHHTHEPTTIRSTSEPTRIESTTLENDSIDPGESAHISAVIENPGDTNWTHEASFRIGDSEIQTQTVTVPAGEERTVEFSQQISQTGDYEIGVDNERTTLTVGDHNSTDDEDTDDTTDEQTPGFGPVVAVVALCVAGIGSRYRSNS